MMLSFSEVYTNFCSMTFFSFKLLIFITNILTIVIDLKYEEIEIVFTVLLFGKVFLKANEHHIL